MANLFVTTILNYGHCRYTGNGDTIISTAITDSTVPVYSMFLAHLVKESVMDMAAAAAASSDGSNNNNAGDGSGGGAVSARERLDVASGMIEDEIRQMAELSPPPAQNEFRNKLQAYQAAWLDLRKSQGQNNAHILGLTKVVSALAAVLTDHGLYQIRASFSHALSDLCVAEGDAEEAFCSKGFQKHVSQLFTALSFTQIHAFAIPRAAMEASDGPNADPALVLARDKFAAEVFIVLESIINGIEEPCTLTDIMAPEEHELTTFYGALTGIEGSVEARSKLLNNRAPAQQAGRENKLKKENTLFALFKRLELASEVKSMMANNAISDDATGVVTLSAHYLGLVKSLRDTVKASLFDSRGRPLPTGYLRGGFRPVAVDTPKKVRFSSLARASDLFEPYVHPWADQNADRALGPVQTIAKAIITLDAAGKAGIKAGPGSAVIVPPSVLAAAQIAVLSGDHAFSFSLSIPVSKFSEGKATFGLTEAAREKKWEERVLSVTPDMVSYYAQGAAGEANKKPLHYSEMEAVILPSPTTPDARRDKALQAAYTKMKDGNICGSILQTPAADIHRKKKRRSKYSSNFNWAGQVFRHHIIARAEERKDNNDEATASLLQQGLAHYSPLQILPDPLPSSPSVLRLLCPQTRPPTRRRRLHGFISSLSPSSAPSVPPRITCPRHRGLPCRSGSPFLSGRRPRRCFAPALSRILRPSDRCQTATSNPTSLRL